MNPSPSLSLLIPVYNEEETLPDFWRQVEEACEGLKTDYHVTWVDDKSTDGSLSILRELAARRPERNSVVGREVNMGIAHGWRDSFELSGDVVGLIPSDGQFHPKHLKEVMEAFTGGTEAAIVTRRRRADTFKRHCISAISRWSERLLMGNPYPDIHWVHFWRGGLVGGIRWFGDTTAIDAEWSYHVLRRVKSPESVKILDLPHYPRAGGAASGGKAGTTLLRLSVLTFLDLARVAVRVRLLRQSALR